MAPDPPPRPPNSQSEPVGEPPKPATENAPPNGDDDEHIVVFGRRLGSGTLVFAIVVLFISIGFLSNWISAINKSTGMSDAAKAWSKAGIAIGLTVLVAGLAALL